MRTMRSPSVRPECSAGDPEMVETDDGFRRYGHRPDGKEQAPKEDDSQHKVHDPAGSDDDQPGAGTDLFKKDFSLSGSSSDMPAMRLNPPRGITRREYSVSPRRVLYSFGPKADSEFIDLHAGPFCRRKMTQFMDEDDEAEYKNSR